MRRRRRKSNDTRVVTVHSLLTKDVLPLYNVRSDRLMLIHVDAFQTASQYMHCSCVTEKRKVLTVRRVLTRPDVEQAIRALAAYDFKRV